MLCNAVRKPKYVNFAFMTQLLLPIFPVATEYLTSTLGVYRNEDFVYYMHNGVPIFSHSSSDMNRFRYVTSHLLVQGLCQNVDIERVFHVSTDSVRRWKKKLSEVGEAAFFSPVIAHSSSHKLLPDVLLRIQTKLDAGSSVNSIAKKENISEGSIRYAIKQGRLKKSPNNKGC